MIKAAFRTVDSFDSVAAVAMAMAMPPPFFDNAFATLLASPASSPASSPAVVHPTSADR
jgi:hypothetical protein